jgi:hypothetical protein
VNTATPGVLTLAFTMAREPKVSPGAPRPGILSKGTTMHLNFIAETSLDGVVDRSVTVGKVPGGFHVAAIAPCRSGGRRSTLFSRSPGSVPMRRSGTRA